MTQKIIRKKKKNKGAIKFRNPVTTKAEGLSYYKAIRANILSPIEQDLRELINLLRMRQSEFVVDGIALDLAGMVQAIKRNYLENSSKYGFISGTIEKKEKSNRQAFKNAIQSSVGVDIPDLVMAENLFDFLQSQVAKNVSLISSIPQQMLSSVETIITNGINQGIRVEEIARQLRKAVNISNQRAKLIARNEMINITSQLNRKRAQNLGIKKFEWVTAGDERVRGNPSGLYPNASPSHYGLNRKTFSYAKGAKTAGGYIWPGSQINCRCQAISIIEV